MMQCAANVYGCCNDIIIYRSQSSDGGSEVYTQELACVVWLPVTSEVHIKICMLGKARNLTSLLNC